MEKKKKPLCFLPSSQESSLIKAAEKEGRKKLELLPSTVLFLRFLIKGAASSLNLSLVFPQSVILPMKFEKEFLILFLVAINSLYIQIHKTIPKISSISFKVNMYSMKNL